MLPLLTLHTDVVPTEPLVEQSAGWFELAILAIVQGLAEFLPISSSGHLVLTQELLGVKESSIALEVALHVGTLFAVFVVYRADLWQIVKDVLRFDLREVVMLVVASIPAAIVGVFFDELIEAAFADVRWVALGLFLTAGFLVFGERLRQRNLDLERDEPLTVPKALLVGVFQAVAICPGISRSGSTIAAGMAVGWSAARAARFSFLISIIAIGGAAILKLPEALQAEGQALRLGFGVVVSALVGWIALVWLLKLLEQGAFAKFAGYCALVGCVVAYLTWR